MNDIDITLLAPEYVAESDGMACGDQLCIHSYMKDEKVYFAFTGNACSVSLESASYLSSVLSGKTKDQILTEIETIMEKSFELFPKMGVRKDCSLTPVKLLQEVLANEGKSCDLEELNKGALACDACVSMRRINWNRKKDKRKKKTETEVLKEMENNKDEWEIKLQKLGLCVLDEEEQRELNALMLDLPLTVFQKIKKLRLAAPYYNNVIKYGLFMNPDIKELVTKQIVSLKVAEKEIDIIDRYIEQHNLMIIPVKGATTQKYYVDKMFRAHMDFDYLSSTIKDAADLVCFLMNERSFHITLGGSVPFSFKSVLDENGEEQITGHIHLEKIMQDRYQVIVDINMCGFPLGRTGVIKFDNENLVDIEELVCITLAHLFKHDIAYIKDINDLYYLLNVPSLNKEKLEKILERYGMEDLFHIAYQFIHDHMGLRECTLIYDTGNVYPHYVEDWPFNKVSHYIVQRDNLISTCKKQFGENEGYEEAMCQICGVNSSLPGKKYLPLCQFLNTRYYLYPIVFFSHYINMELKELQGFKAIISGALYMFEDIVILPFGMFVLQSDEKAISREMIESQIKRIIEILDITREDCHFNYVKEARKDTWLY